MRARREPGRLRRLRGAHCAVPRAPRLARARRAPQANQQTLESMRTDLPHAPHPRFVGRGTALAALTQWELADASAELDGKRAPADGEVQPGRGDGQYVVAAQLLTESDIKARTKY